MPSCRKRRISSHVPKQRTTPRLIMRDDLPTTTRLSMSQRQPCPLPTTATSLELQEEIVKDCMSRNERTYTATNQNTEESSDVERLGVDWAPSSPPSPQHSSMRANETAEMVALVQPGAYRVGLGKLTQPESSVDDDESASSIVGTRMTAGAQKPLPTATAPRSWWRPTWWWKRTWRPTSNNPAATVGGGQADQ